MLDVDVQVRDEFDLIIADVGAPVMDLDGSPSPVIAGPPRESRAVARSRIIAPTWPNQMVVACDRRGLSGGECLLSTMV